MQKYGSHIALALLLGLVGLSVYLTERESLEGELAAAFTLSALDGDLRTGPQEHVGKVVLVDFWAVYCPPCVESLPALQSIYDTYDHSEFCLLSVNVDRETQERNRVVRGFLRTHRIQFPVLLDRGEASTAYQVSNIPHVVLIDRMGKIRFVHRGEVSEQRLRREIEGLLAEGAS